MKNLFLVLIILIGQVAKAQDVTLDKEKLLELYQNQRYADAASYLQSIYPANTTDVKALSQIAYCNMMAGNLPSAEKNYLTINEVQPNTVPVLFSLASINAKRGNNQKAAGYLLQIIGLDSTSFNAYKRLADLTDSVENKVLYLKKANQLNATDADVAYDLAIQYRNLKQYDPAYKVLKIAIAADTGNFILQQALLPIANQLKKYNEVITIGLKLLANGADANVIKDVGSAYYFLNDYKQCLKYYKILEAMDAQNEAILYFMSISYRELKNYEMAATYAKKTIDEGISPNVALYYSLLAGIYEEKQHYTTALNAYQKGLTFSNYNSIYYRMALLYDLKLNRTKDAIKYYNLYLKSKPNAKVEANQITYTKDRIVELTKPKP
eukprot:GDKJ01022941.1.p1 GENE.GDKJ01022941.1~~GDKJ01022941.1.p1  ORF type:complete len:381 (+),score=9.55 GDKJ01022941.1:140-1282(+)